MDLKSLVESAWLQLGGGTDESRIKLEAMIEDAKGLYAWEMLQWAWKERREEGFYLIPSHLSTEVELPVENNEIDISSLKMLKYLPQEMYLQNIGGLTCECEYIKTTINQAQLMCDDDSLPDNSKTYLIVGKKIKFPKGAHANKLSIIYANDGTDIDDSLEVEDAMAGVVRVRLIELYAGKTIPEDKTNNTTSNV